MADLARALGPVVAEKHLMLASIRPTEQRALLDLGVTGAMAPVRGDFVGLVTQNAGGNKIDRFLRRGTRHPAPAAGLTPYVIGNLTTPRLPIGTNRTYLSVYSPLFLAAPRWMVASGSSSPRSRPTTSCTPPTSTSRPVGQAVLELDLEGRVDAAGYQLGIHRQPFLAPDTVTTALEVPAGWRVNDGSNRTRARPVQQSTDRSTRWSIRRAS